MWNSMKMDFFINNLALKNVSLLKEAILRMKKNILNLIKNILVSRSMNSTTKRSKKRKVLRRKKGWIWVIFWISRFFYQSRQMFLLTIWSIIYKINHTLLMIIYKKKNPLKKFPNMSVKLNNNTHFLVKKLKQVYKRIKWILKFLQNKNKKIKTTPNRVSLKMKL